MLEGRQERTKGIDRVHDSLSASRNTCTDSQKSKPRRDFQIPQGQESTHKMKAFQGPWAGIWNKAGHSWRSLQWVRMISFKSHVGMVIWGQSNDVQRIFLTITVYKDVNIFFPSKEIPSGAPGLLSLHKTFSSVETNPSAPCMVTRLGNS